MGLAVLWAKAAKRRFQRLRCPKAFPPSPSPEKHIPSSKYQPDSTAVPVEGRNAGVFFFNVGGLKKKGRKLPGFCGICFFLLSKVC